MTYEQIQKANESIKTTDIKGKQYAEVNQRIKAFRMLYPEGFIKTYLISNENGVCVFSADVGKYDEKGLPVVLGTGTAYEKESSSFINKTSYIENCETSAVGRALGMCGLGVDTSVASYEEVQNAINNQDKPKKQKPSPHENVIYTQDSDKNAPIKPEYGDDVIKCPQCGNPVLREFSKKQNRWLEPKEVLEQCGGVCLPCYRIMKG